MKSRPEHPFLTELISILKRFDVPVNSARASAIIKKIPAINHEIDEKEKKITEDADFHSIPKKIDVNQQHAVFPPSGFTLFRDSDHDDTLINMAISRGQVSLVQDLIEAKADIHQGSWQAIHETSYYSLLPAIEICVKAGADVNAQSKFNHTPLSIASNNRYPTITKYLLDQKANSGIDIQSTNVLGGETALHYAAFRGCFEIARQLVDAKANIDIRNGYGETPICISIRAWHSPISVLLLERKADINAKTRSGDGPLHRAIDKNDLRIASLLIDAKADIEAVYKNATPLEMVMKSLQSFNNKELSLETNINDIQAIRNFILILIKLINMNAIIKNPEKLYDILKNTYQNYPEMQHLLNTFIKKQENLPDSKEHHHSSKLNQETLNNIKDHLQKLTYLSNSCRQYIWEWETITGDSSQMPLPIDLINIVDQYAPLLFNFSLFKTDKIQTRIEEIDSLHDKTIDNNQISI